MSTDRHGQLGSDLYIDGDREPIPGRGGGSFANHQTCIGDCSAEFTLVNGKAYLAATRNIAAHEEIFVNCGTDLLVMMGRKRRVCKRDIDGRLTVVLESVYPSPWGMPESACPRQGLLATRPDVSRNGFHSNYPRLLARFLATAIYMMIALHDNGAVASKVSSNPRAAKRANEFLNGFYF